MILLSTESKSWEVDATRAISAAAARAAASHRSETLGTIAALLFLLDIEAQRRKPKMSAKLRDTLRILNAILYVAQRPSNQWCTPALALSEPSSSLAYELRCFGRNMGRFDARVLSHLFCSLDQKRSLVSAQKNADPSEGLLMHLKDKLEMLLPSNISQLPMDDSSSLEIAEDYRMTVNDEAYKTIAKYIVCCSDRDIHSGLTKPGHIARLCLSTDPFINDRDVVFKMLFSRSSNWASQAISMWQQVGLYIPRSKPVRRLKQPINHPTRLYSSESSGVCTADTKPTVKSAQDFCALLNNDIGPSCLLLRVNEDHLLFTDSEPGECLDESDTISFAEVLRGRFILTTQMKLVLAYILAYSAWRLYTSDWMKLRWSAESIHFSKYRSPGARSMRPDIFAQHPCFALHFNPVTDEVNEYHSSRPQPSMKFPRLLALAGLLVQVGWDEPLPHKEYTSLKQLNTEHCELNSMAKRNQAWPSFDTTNDSIRQRYRQIVLRSLDGKLLNVEQDPEERRATIFKHIVAPLKSLLESTESYDDLMKLGPMRERVYKPNFHPTIQNPEESQNDVDAVGAQLLGLNANKSSSKKWIENIQQHYKYMILQNNNRIRSLQHIKTRIAVLDTGYDPDADFFNRDRKRHLQNVDWRDWVADSRKPVDEDGHGTQILSLLMKMAPLVDIVVARIARSSQDLVTCDQNIASAIKWATEERRVDIVSMSFGFAREKGSVITSAINEALSLRGAEVLFFAAAGNEGGNTEKVMFPARHRQVIPVYGTDADGVYLNNLNPPITGDVFGTLAENVPCCDKDVGEVNVTGTSFATAILAGWAGTLLDYTSLLEHKLACDRNMDQFQTERKNVPRRKHLCKQDGMIEMFKNTAVQLSTSAGQYYVNPLHFFQRSEEEQEAWLVTAILRST